MHAPPAEETAFAVGDEGDVDVIDAIKTRRSIGKLEGDVSPDDVRELVALALCAPNHKLTAPVRYISLRGAARERLAAVWAQVARELPLPPGTEREAFVAKESRKPLRAPVLLVIAVRTDEDAIRAEEDFATAAAAAQNVLLGAHAKGLGAIWRTGEMALDPNVKSHLGLEPTDRIAAIVYIGQPASAAPAIPAAAVADFLTERD